MTTPGETTAERLLAYPGLRRVPSPKIELFDRPGFLPPELCARLIALIDHDRSANHSVHGLNALGVGPHCPTIINRA